MKKLVTILVILVVAGCKSPASIEPKSDYDLAIEKLSMSTGELDSISKEKDFYVKVLEDFEKQKLEYGYLLDSQQILNEMQYLQDWHRDIVRREREISYRHALNVYDAHTQAVKKYRDTNEIPVITPASNK